MSSLNSIKAKTIALLKKLLKNEIKLLLSLALIIGGLWVFIELSENLNEGSTHEFDLALLKSLREENNLSQPKGPDWLKEFFVEITSLGSGYILLLLSLAVAGFLLLKKKFFMLLMVIGSTIGGYLVYKILKALFARERPEEIFHLVDVDPLSFPSGHSMMAAIVYLTLAALLMQTQKNNFSKFYIMIIALFLTFLIGISRLYLGVHYATDVLAGWMVGLSWASIWWLIARYLSKKHNLQIK